MFKFIMGVLITVGIGVFIYAARQPQMQTFEGGIGLTLAAGVAVVIVVFSFIAYNLNH